MTIISAYLKENKFDRVHDSQKTFKTLMTSMSNPGRIFRLPEIPLRIDMPEIHYILYPFLTLLDLEVVFHVSSREKTVKETVTRYFEVNTNSNAASIELADYLLCLDQSVNILYNQAKTGSLSRPHKSATIFYLVNRLSSKQMKKGLELIISGPGVAEENRVWITGLVEKTVDIWRTCDQDYPMGVDIFLISRDGAMIGIPRSVKVGRK